jgi:hypothetical protein
MPAHSDTSSFKFMQPKLMARAQPKSKEETKLENERKKKEIFEDSREASIAIFKAQAGLKKT